MINPFITCLTLVSNYVHTVSIIQTRVKQAVDFFCRLLFAELRQSVQQLVSHPRCPGFLNSLVFRVTAFIANLAPPVMTAPAPQASS